MPYRVDTLDPRKTAMIIVDMQNDFVAPGAPMETTAARAMVPNLAAALRFCRDVGIRVIYTAHVHRRDGCDMGLYDDLWPPIASRVGLVDGIPGRRVRCDARQRGPCGDAHHPVGLDDPCHAGEGIDATGHDGDPKRG